MLISDVKDTSVVLPDALSTFGLQTTVHPIPGSCHTLKTKTQKKVVGRVRLERTTSGLKVRCSTN